MAKPPQDVTEAELAVLEVLWEEGPTTIRRVTDRLYPDGGVAQYSTVQKLLDRLEEKGHVTRDRSTPAHMFTAATAREELIGRRLQEVAEKLCGGSLTPLLTHLVRTQKLSTRERQELRALIDEAERKRQRRK
jgi:BlaI family penicillinase repressor